MWQPKICVSRDRESKQNLRISVYETAVVWKVQVTYVHIYAVKKKKIFLKTTKKYADVNSGYKQTGIMVFSLWLCVFSKFLK